jgi:hypothetical protein
MMKLEDDEIRRMFMNMLHDEIRIMFMNMLHEFLMKLEPCL